MATLQQMSKKRMFVQDGVFNAELNEFLVRELAEDGYSGVEVGVTPLRTEIIIPATRTQNVLVEGMGKMPSFEGFGSNLFGYSTAFGESSQPAFGSTSTSTFPSTSTPTSDSATTLAFGFTQTSEFETTCPLFCVSNVPTFGSGVFGLPSAFGAQMPFGSQVPTPVLRSTAFLQSAFGGQRRGNRVAAYSPTAEVNGGDNSTQQAGNESILVKCVYKDKSNEDSRFEDDQLGDKGGSSAAAAQSNPFGPVARSYPFGTPAAHVHHFGVSTCAQSSMNPFSSTSSNLFYSKPSPFGTTSSSSPFGSPPTTKPFATQSTRFGANSSPFRATSSTSVSTFGSTQTGGPSAAAQPATQSRPLGAPAAQSNPFGVPAAQSNPFGTPAAQYLCGTPAARVNPSLGTIVVAMKFEGGLCFGTDSRKTIETDGRIMYTDSAKKIEEISERPVYILKAGGERCINNVATMLRRCLRKKEELTSLSLCQVLQKELSKDPHNSGFILCGVEPDDSYFIKVIEPNGNFRDCDYGMCGSGATPRLQDQLRDWHAKRFDMAAAQRIVVYFIITAILNTASCGGMVSIYTFDGADRFIINHRAEHLPWYYEFQECKNLPLQQLTFPGFYPFAEGWKTVG